MIEGLVAKYGLLAIFAGAGIEGEAVVVTGGVLAQRGLVPLWGAMIAATLGSFIVDQLWFLAGRRFRDHPRIRRIAEKPAFTRATRFLENHPRAFILSFRFIYGMRTVSPIAIGMSHIPIRRFVALNLLAAILWAPFFTWLGFWLGKRAEPLLRRIGGVGLHVVAGIAILTAIVGAGYALYRWRKRRRTPASE